MLKKELIPVLHIHSEEQAINNLDLLLECGVKQVFIIGHEGKFSRADNLLNILNIACHKGFWCGINFLGYDPIDILKQYGERSFDALWYDNSFAGIDNARTKAIFDTREEHAKHIQLFGGVAFKYCPQPQNLKEACTIAANYMDVIVTSGSGTGVAADINKINEMRNYIGNDSMLGIASGITPENVNEYKANCLLVSTGISKDFYNFDKNKIINLLAQLQEEYQ